MIIIFENSNRQKLLYWSIEILIALAMIYLATKVDFIFTPIFTFFTTLFIPFLLAGFLFYILNPIVKFLTKVRYKRFGISRNFAIFIVFILLILILGLIIGYFIPRTVEQIGLLIKSIPAYADNLETMFNKSSISHNPMIKQIDFSKYFQEYRSVITKFLRNIVFNIPASIGNIFSTLATTAINAITVPFVLFYMLKDGDKLKPAVKHFVAPNKQKEVERLLNEVNSTMSKYVSGQMIECLSVGVLSVIGYSIVGVPYSALVGTFAGITNIIPYLGPYIGLIPAILLSMSSGSMFKVLLVILVCIIVQQIDGNLVYPNVIGKSLNIHPLTIIVILLVAGNIAGLLGIILGVPVYAVAKVLINFILHFIELRREEKLKS